MMNLQLLDLSYNKITLISRNMFIGLQNMNMLNLTFNDILHVSVNSFQNLMLYSVHSFNLKICCISGSWNKCKVKGDAYSNCDRLLSHLVIMYTSWFWVILGLSFNLLTLLFHLNFTKIKLQSHSYFLVFLSLVDMIFGIYLITTAISDLHFGDSYVGYDTFWRNSIICKLASLLALVHMMSCPMVICLMIIARFSIVQWPINSRFLQRRFIKKVLFFILFPNTCFSITICFITFSILQDDTSTNICFLVYSSQNQQKYHILTSLGLVVCQIASLILIYMFSTLSMVILERNECETDIPDMHVKTRKVMHNLSIVIITVSVCWIPTCIVLILPILKYSVPNIVLTSTVTCVAPITSVFDPLLFTFFFTKC